MKAAAIGILAALLVAVLLLGRPVRAFILAGIAGVAVGNPLVAWLAGLFAQLGCFFVALIAIGWSYEKLRDWWASRE